jgi:hypothetical protein
MPATKIQSEVLKLLASQRTHESFVAGGVPINRDGPRYSKDIDIFHDTVAGAAEAAARDSAALKVAGFEIVWERQVPGISTAVVLRGGDSTKLEWVANSDYRYFPAIPDSEFGFVLHPADLAINKVLAASGRQELRDFVDLVTIDEHYLPIGPIAWAAVEVSLGFTPEGLVGEMRRNLRFNADDFAKLQGPQPIDGYSVLKRLRAAFDRAEAFILAMPSDAVGVLFLEGGQPVQPDPKALDRYHWHRGARRGHWPSSPEIAAAMLERHGIVPGGRGV